MFKNLALMSVDCFYKYVEKNEPLSGPKPHGVVPRTAYKYFSQLLTILQRYRRDWEKQELSHKVVGHANREGSADGEVHGCLEMTLPVQT